MQFSHQELVFAIVNFLQTKQCQKRALNELVLLGVQVKNKKGA